MADVYGDDGGERPLLMNATDGDCETKVINVADIPGPRSETSSRRLYDDAESDFSDSEHSVAPPPEPGFQLLRVGSPASGCVNLAQSALGAGTLSMPYAMRNAGVGLGSVFLICCAIASVYSVRLLIIFRDRTHCETYEAIAAKLIHPWAKHVVAVLICLFCWGITIVYVIAIGDIIHPLTDGDSFPDIFKGDRGRMITGAAFWAMFMLPLSLLRDINALRYPSLFALVTLLGLVLSLLVHLGLNGQEGPNRGAPISIPAASSSSGPDEVDLGKIEDEGWAWAIASIDMLCALPTMFFSYCCQCNAFEVYHEMKPKSVIKMTQATGAAMGFATFVYIFAGIAGVVNFGNKTDSNILKNFTDDVASTPYMMAAFIGFAFTITFSFPVCLFPVRDAILQILHVGDVYHAPTWIRLVVAASIATASLLVGTFVSKIIVMFSILGGVCGSSLAFILPGLFAVRSGEWTREKVGVVHWLAAWALVIGGSIAGVLGTCTGLYKTFK